LLLDKKYRNHNLDFCKRCSNTVSRKTGRGTKGRQGCVADSEHTMAGQKIAIHRQRLSSTIQKDINHSIVYSATFPRLDSKLKTIKEWRTISEPTFCLSSEAEGRRNKARLRREEGSTLTQFVESPNLTSSGWSLLSNVLLPKFKLISKTVINDIT